MVPTRTNTRRALRAFVLAELENGPATIWQLIDRHNARPDRKVEATSAAMSSAVLTLYRTARIGRLARGAYCAARGDVPPLAAIRSRAMAHHEMLARLIDAGHLARGRAMKAAQVPAVLAELGWPRTYQTVMRYLRRCREDGLATSPHYGVVALSDPVKTALAGEQ